MRITINAFGSRGDVQPYVALGKGLLANGHQVRLHTHRLFEAFVLENGLELFPIDVDPRQVLVSQSVSQIGRNPVRMNRWLTANFRPVLGQAFEATLEACRDADLMVNSILSFAGYHVAEKLDMPVTGALLQPATPTRAFPGAGTGPAPGWLPFKGLYNYLSIKLTNQAFFFSLRSLVNDCRKEVLGLPPMGASQYWRLDRASYPVPILYGYSPSVVPKPADWTDYQQVTGYWFLESQATYEPPTELQAFLDAGPPPVYVGFGSMVDHERGALTQLVLEALARSGQRGILLGGWSELGSADLPKEILPIDFAPHDWLFPRTAAVVHHGGAGTTAAGLRAGAPSIVIPFFADQYFWGGRVEQIGAGPAPIARRNLTVAKLARAIDQAVNDERIRQGAADIGFRIRDEDGVGEAVRLIEQFW